MREIIVQKKLWCICRAVDCRSNYAGEERTTVFPFPTEESLRKIWTKFEN